MTATGHPSWCALPPVCSAGQPGGGHRSAPALYRAPAVAVEVALHRPVPVGETFTTVVCTDPMVGIADGFSFTLSMADAWRLVDTLTGLWERAR